MTFSAGQKRYLNCCLAGITLLWANAASAASTITVTDAALTASFYSDSSCLLTIDSLAQSGKTVIDADVDDQGSRMLLHCDTESGRRLTMLARGDALDVSQRVPLLTREEIQEGEFGMIAWLTRSGVHYADDTAPRRYVIAGSVLLRESPPVDVAGNALHSERIAFGTVSGTLEPIVKSDSMTVLEPLPDIDVKPDDPDNAETDAAVDQDESDNAEQKDTQLESQQDSPANTRSPGESETHSTSDAVSK